MKRLVVALAVSIATACLVVAPTASGKGASEATITGPGLGGPIQLAGEGQAGGERLMQIAQDTGFFAAVFTQIPDPMLDAQPEGTLGPKYTIEYVMPGPNQEQDTIVQDVYPYATPDPVAYVKPGQHYWSTQQTRGGWYVGYSGLKDDLVAAGLPATAPADDAGPSGPPWSVIGPALALAALALLGGFAIVATRRRPRPA
jgi:hypothetical protein